MLICADRVGWWGGWQLDTWVDGEQGGIPSVARVWALIAAGQVVKPMGIVGERVRMGVLKGGVRNNC